MRIALAQINPTVGDIAGNTSRILRDVDQAKSGGADLIVFPELAVFGYPPKDLVLRRELVQKNLAAVEQIASASVGITTIVGYVKADPTGAGKGCLNAAAVCQEGKVVGTYAKMLLPTYDVFDESRYFNPGRESLIVPVAADGATRRIGLTICEDLWNDRQFAGRRMYDVDPVKRAVEAGAQLLINLSASPFRVGVNEQREGLFSAQVRAHQVPLVYVNQVGGNDDLIFDGASAAYCTRGVVVGRAKSFAEDLLMVDPFLPATGRIEPYPDRVDSIHQGLVLGLGDYVRKCGFDRVVLGLSGGIDSALVAVLAAEAIDGQRVEGVAMPSRYSSKHSLEDAEILAKNLGMRLRVVPIEGVHRAFEESVDSLFRELDSGPPGVAEENVQARIRGNLLMAVSNKSGSLLLTTGNKSELAVGYCTLYGDMCGGLAVLSDVPKTMVYTLARRINEQAGREIIPRRTIEKPPSAELKENQTDQDTLPPYDILDAVLEHYIERETAVEEIVALGFDRATVERVAQMVDRSEHKRKQAAVGLKVTSRAFGTGRRMPIAAKHR